jgi:hypothetical protein
MAKATTGEAPTLRKVQVGVRRGEAQEAVKRLARDGDTANGGEERRLLEEQDGVILVVNHD